MKTRKAQAALEFLSTYGFAFLIILVMIGALAYFGVLNPQRFLPNSCVATTGFGCTEYQYDGATDTMLVTLSNNLGSTTEIKADSFAFTTPETGTATTTPSGTCDVGIPAGAKVFGITPHEVTAGLGFEFECADAAIFKADAGEKKRATLTFEYRAKDKTYWQPAEVQIFTQVK